MSTALTVMPSGYPGVNPPGGAFEPITSSPLASSARFKPELLPPSREVDIRPSELWDTTLGNIKVLVAAHLPPEINSCSDRLVCI